MRHLFPFLFALLFLSCTANMRHDLLVENRACGYYIHGDTLETHSAPNYCNKFEEGDLPHLENKKSVLRAYPFLSCQDSSYNWGDERQTAHLFRHGATMLLLYSPTYAPLVYANIEDGRVKIQQGIHVGMSTQEVIQRIGFPHMNQKINHIIFERAFCQLYTFDFSGDTLHRIQIQTDIKKDMAWNPAPYFEYVEPALSRSDHGPKIYAHGKDSLEWFEPVCYLNAEGDTIVPFSRGYDYQNWDEIGRMGLVHRGPDPYCFMAINHKGEELFQVFILLDGSPDCIGDGLFRIVSGPDEKIGYADTLGNVVIKPQFAYGSPFRYGRAKVTMKGGWDKSHPEAWIWKSDDWFFIDRSGRRIGYVDNTANKRELTVAK